MKNFAAFGCETANFERTSVSSVGVVVVRDGKKEHLFYFLEHSEPDYYNLYARESTISTVKTLRMRP